MTDGEALETKHKYDESFIEQCKDLAVLGLQPVQIAERLGLEGIRRQHFLQDCTSQAHPLYSLLFMARQHGEEDIDAALMTAAVSGDTGALELAYKVKQERDYDDLRKKLFGI